MSISYIGADVDSKMVELAVERKSRIVARDRIPTDIKSIRTFLHSIPGTKIMVIEEGPMSGWLYRNLRTDVTEFVVCDPRRNKAIYADGDKHDAVDAAGLAGLLRGSYVRKVYHTTDEKRLALKESVALYHDRRKDATRQINKLRAAGRGYGIRIPALTLKDAVARKTWLNELDDTALARRLSLLWMGLDTARQQVTLAKADVARRAAAYPIISYWRELPGIGLIHAATLFAYLDTPWRFSKPAKLWKYCGLGLKRTASGSDEKGRPRPGYLHLHRGVNPKLKAAILSAVLIAIRKRNPFADHYNTMIRAGVTASNARHTVGRKMLSTLWGMWKTNSRYDERLV